MPGCRVGGSQRATLVLRRARKSGRDVARWKLAHGGTVGDDALAAPVAGAADVRLCVYDAGETGPVVALRVPGGGTCGNKACWRRAGGGSRYRDKAATQGGVSALRLRSSRGELSVRLKARGANLRLPPLDLAMPVVAQLLVGDDETATCWQAVLDTARRHDARVFRATQP